MLWTLNILPVESLPPALIAESTRANHNPQTNVVVMVAWPVIVTVGGATVITIVVPRAATEPEWHNPLSPSPSSPAQWRCVKIVHILQDPISN